MAEYLIKYKTIFEDYNKQLFNQLDVVKQVNTIVNEYGYNISIIYDYTYEFRKYKIVYNGYRVAECNFDELEVTIKKLIDNT